MELDLTNSNSVILNSPLFQIQNHFPVMCTSVIYYLENISNSTYFQLFLVFPESSKQWGSNAHVYIIRKWVLRKRGTLVTTRRARVF